MSIPGPGDLGFLLPEDRDEANLGRWLCCFGGAMYGPDACTCWEPVHDQDQAPVAAGPPATRVQQCHDCAYRKGSPERERGDDIDGVPEFWCHQGLRRIVAWVHPDGRRRPEPFDGAYDPVQVRGALIFRADGQPGERCAGWARVNRVRP